MDKKNDQWFFHKPPKNLTLKEREEWEEAVEFELEEYKRRMREGLYPHQELPKKKSRGWKLIQKLFGRG